MQWKRVELCYPQLYKRCNLVLQKCLSISEDLLHFHLSHSKGHHQRRRTDIPRLLRGTQARYSPPFHQCVGPWKSMMDLTVFDAPAKSQQLLEIKFESSNPMLHWSTP